MKARLLQSLSLTVDAVRDLMADTLRAFRRSPGGASAYETTRALQLGIQEIELLWGELQEQAEQLRHERERHAGFFDSVQDACLITDARGIIFEANRSAAELLGTSPERLRGRSLDALQSTFAALDLVPCPAQPPGDEPVLFCWLLRPRQQAAA